jgi:quinoprotein glucose dehydrogenase
LLASGILLFRRNAAGIWLYALTWLATLIWAYWEVGIDGWGLMPRTLAPTVILVFVLLPLPFFGGGGRRRHARVSYAGASVAFLVLAAAVGWNHLTVEAQSQEAAPVQPVVPGQAGTTQQVSPTTTAADASAHMPGKDWPVYGGSELARRYSPLDQITTANASELTKVWTFHTGDMPDKATKDEYSPENTPLEVDGHLFACWAKGIVISVNAATGKEEWRYDPKVADDAIPYGATCRGVAYYAVQNAAADQPCATRIEWGTLDARLIAIDAKTGKLCQDFGAKGVVDLNQGIGKTVPGWYSVTAPPTIVHGIAVVGAQVQDGQAEDAPQVLFAVTTRSRASWPGPGTWAIQIAAARPLRATHTLAARRICGPLRRPIPNSAMSTCLSAILPSTTMAATARTSRTSSTLRSSPSM